MHHTSPETLNDRQLRTLEREWIHSFGIGTPHEAEVWIGQPCGERKGLLLLLAARFKNDTYNLPTGNHLAGLVSVHWDLDTQLNLLDRLESEAADWHKEFVQLIQQIQQAQIAG